MNDHEAIDEINKVLDQMFRGELTPTAAIFTVVHISGMNKIEHEAAKEQK